MDDPAATREDIELSLRYLRLVNRRLGGAAALLRRLNQWRARWPAGRPITIVDLGTGSADIPLSVRDWGARRGLDIRVTGVDLHPTTLDLARRHVGGREGITLVQGDATRLTEQFEPGSFDYAHASLFLHHLPDIQVLTVLRVMDRLAVRGIVWSDLIRSSARRLLVAAAVVGQPPIVRHDAVVSVEAGFTRREVMDYTRRLGLDYVKYRMEPLWYRFTLAGEKA